MLPSILKVCQRVADLYPKNYYAWTQRSWVVLRAVGEATSTPEGSEDREDKISLVKDLVSDVLHVQQTLHDAVQCLNRKEGSSSQHDFSEGIIQRRPALFSFEPFVLEPASSHGTVLFVAASTRGGFRGQVADEPCFGSFRSQPSQECCFCPFGCFAW